MKQLVAALAMTAFLFSCSTEPGKGKFTLDGELKGVTDGEKMILEELFFSDKAPEVLDTGMVKDGKFTVSAIAKEEGLYRVRNEKGDNSYLFINDGENIVFKAEPGRNELAGHSFSGSSNSSLRSIMQETDSVGKLMANKGQLINTLVKSGVAGNDSVLMVLNNEYKALNENFTGYCFAFADSAKSPLVSLFAATMAPVDITLIDATLTKLTRRFPKHKGIGTAAAYIKGRITGQTGVQPAPAPSQVTVSVGSPAPDITMNDVDDKPFSLSSLKGKYVLVDFWASWCGPCRDENPNIVAAYNQYKDKNFTVLGVSLDKNKTAWINAIKEDKLNWQHISDLKYWSSAAVDLYGFDGIPYNVLVDPQGTIIATNLRGNALQNKLAELLK